MSSPSRKMHALIVKCSLKMHTLILISLATAAATGDSHSCYDYCTLLSTGQIKEIAWSRDCTCDTEKLKNFGKFQKGNMPTSEGASAIYYEPAELSYAPELSFIYQPYIIVNPTLRDSSISDNVGSMTKTSYTIDKQATHTDVKLSTKQKRQEIFHTNIIEKKEQPFYLDIDVKKPSKYVRTFQKESNAIDNFELTEEDLQECLDLHMIIHFRKYDDISGLQTIWNDDKINKYNNLSTDDLMREIDIKCSRPTNIFEQSLNEIKATFPRKKNPQMRYNENSNMTTNAIRNISKNYNKTQDKNQNIEVTTNLNNILNFDSIVTDKDIKASSSIVSKQSDINGIIDSHITTTSRSITKLLSPHSTLKRNENIDLDNIALTPTVTNTESKFDDGAELKTGTSMTYRKKMNSYVPQNEIEIITVPSFEEQQSFRSVNKTYGTVFQDIEHTSQITSANQVYESIAYQDTFNSSEPIDVSKNSDGVNFKIISSQENRTVYPEIEMKIPKIVVKEYPNETTISEVDGNEQIPNNDFIDANFNSTQVNNNIDNINVTTSYKDTTKIVNITGSAINFEVDLTTEISTKSHEISGNLYFLFDEESVPARFVQKPNGNISLGIDGQSLCNKITKDSKNYSSLLTILCKCAKFHNCSNNVLN